MGAATTDEWATVPATDTAADIHPHRLELVLRALPVAFLVALGWSHRWVEEDAFLNFRIVDQIRAGHGPVFNIGQRVEVATSPLWLAMLTVARSVVPFVRIEYLSIAGGLVLTGLGLWWVQARPGSGGSRAQARSCPSAPSWWRRSPRAGSGRPPGSTTD